MNKSVRLISDALGQHAALTRPFIALQTEKTNFALSSKEMLPEKVERLRRALGLFSFEMKNHLDFEQGVITEIADQKSTKEILTAHKEIIDKLDAAEKLLKNNEYTNLNQRDFLLKKNEILLLITDLYTCVSEHYSKEDTLLRAKLKELEKLSQ